MIKVGIMGGTFDPIHYGHLLAAETAREACGLDEVWFVPSGHPPLKESGPLADGASRLEMVYRAIDFQPHFRAMDIELEREGTSFTIDTIQTLNELYPDRTFSIIIGADRVNDLAQWQQIEALAEIASFIGVTRAGETLQLEQIPDCVKDKLTMVEMPLLEISSTVIRERVAAGRSIRFLIPEKVHSFIRRNGLYESR